MLVVGVAYSHHFDEEHTPDPYQRRKSDQNPHQSEKRVRIRFKVKSSIWVTSDPDPQQSEKQDPDLDTHQSGKLDPDLDTHQSGKLDPDLNTHLSGKLDPDLDTHLSGKLDPDLHESDQTDPVP